MKKLSEEFEQLVSLNPYLRKTLERVQNTIDDLTTDNRLYAIEVKRLECALNRFRAERDEFSGCLTKLDDINKGLNEDKDQLLSDNKYLNNRLDRVRTQRDEANERTIQFENAHKDQIIKKFRLIDNLKGVRAQRDEANGRIIDLEDTLNIQRENTRIAYDEVNRLRDIITDFSESALGVLNDD